MPSKTSVDPLGAPLAALVNVFVEALVAGVKAAIADAGLVGAVAPAKRGPGRPPKSAVTLPAAKAAAANPPKRGPGQPPKAAASVPASKVVAANPPKRGPGRPPKTGGKPCLVQGCGKKTVAKGLCQGHYRKAVRIGVVNKLDKVNLAKLTKDGRATRWAKKK